MMKKYVIDDYDLNMCQCWWLISVEWIGEYDGLILCENLIPLEWRLTLAFKALQSSQPNQLEVVS